MVLITSASSKGFGSQVSERPQSRFCKLALSLAERITMCDEGARPRSLTSRKNSEPVMIGIFRSTKTTDGSLSRLANLERASSPLLAVSRTNPLSSASKVNNSRTSALSSTIKTESDEPAVKVSPLKCWSSLLSLNVAVHTMEIIQCGLNIKQIMFKLRCIGLVGGIGPTEERHLK